MLTRRFHINMLTLLSVILLSKMAAFAVNADVASLRVVVRDPAGAAVVASLVRIKAEGNNEQTLSTDQQGITLFSRLTPGKYHIHVEATGFASRDLEDVVLKAGSNQIEVRLEIADIKEDVLVKQDLREAKTDQRGDAFATILTEEQIANLPDDPEEMEATLKRMAGPGAIIRVNGFTGGRLPPKSEIRQIRFRRNSYAAEYHEGGFIGIDVLTKPGVENWHGSFGFNFRDEALNARNAFAPRRGPEQFRRLEFSLDVPLWRNRTSLFLAADGNQSYDAQTIVTALPEGHFADFARRPSRTLYTLARLIHALSKTHTLIVGYERNARRSDNLGVGDFDLPERAYSLNQAENLLRLSETGTIGKRLFNELRIQLRFRDIMTQPASDAPAIIVLDAFNRGGAQRQSNSGLRTLEIAENVDFGFRQHAMRAGLLLEAGTYENDSRLNSGGTFVFASLDDFRSARPSTFTQRVGSHPLRFSQYQLGAYWEDDLRLHPNLTVSFGLR
jgi:hypothetical protein